MNTFTVTGNLGNNPESFFTPEGTHIISFPLAFRSGKDKTSWIKVTCFNKTADLAEKYLQKGDRVGVSGSLDQEKWTDSEGAQRSGYKLLANSIEFIKLHKQNTENPHEDDFVQEQEG